MSRLIFDADTLGGTTTLSSADAVGNFTLTVPAVNGTLSVKDASNDATFRNITLTGAVLAGAWNGSTITVPYGGTGATTLTGYVKGNGTSAMTASTTIPNTDITGLGTMSTQNANAVAISGGTISGLSAAIPVGSGGTGATALTGYVKGNGTSIMTASSTIPNTDITGLGTMSTQGADSVAITGGTANGLTIGAVNPAAGVFTTLRFNSTLSANGTTGTAGQVLTSNGASAPTWQSVAGVGTVTSVDGSGGTTGLTLTGGPITSSGTLTLGGTLAIANGGTGATSASAARTALGLGTIAIQAASAVAITGGAIDGTTVGATTASTGAFTTLSASSTVSGTGFSTYLASPPAIGSTTAAAGSFTTLNSSGNTRLGGLSGNQSLQVNNVASAVNYAQIVGAVTGGAPTLSAQGTDTNIGLVLTGKGAGVVALGGTTTANSGFVVSPVASSVNYIEAKGAATGQAVYLSAQGTDANIPLIIQSKGTQPFYFVGNNAIQFATLSTASAVNYAFARGGATGSGASIGVQGSDTNINLSLTPKGTGAVQVTGTGFSPNFTLTDAATIAWDTTTAGGQTATFTFVSSNRTMGAPTNLKNGAFYALAVIQNGGSNTLTWNSVFKWAAGTAPTLSTAAGAKDYFTFRSDGTNMYQQGISQAVA
jgi:hypothetical protein